MKWKTYRVSAHNKISIVNNIILSIEHKSMNQMRQKTKVEKMKWKESKANRVWSTLSMNSTN